MSIESPDAEPDVTTDTKRIVALLERIAKTLEENQQLLIEILK